MSTDVSFPVRVCVCVCGFLKIFPREIYWVRLLCENDWRLQLSNYTNASHITIINLAAYNASRKLFAIIGENYFICMCFRVRGYLPS